MEEKGDSLEVARLFKDVLFLYKHTMGKAFENVGITAPQGMVIGILSKEGKLKISDLSSKLGLSNSTVSGIIDRLEKQEIVERERCDDDKRVVYVNLSSKFENMHQNFHKIAEDSIKKIMSKATSEDLEKIVEGLNALKKLLSD